MNLIQLAEDISNNEEKKKDLFIINLSKYLDDICTDEDILKEKIKKSNGGPSDNLIAINKSLLNEIKNNEQLNFDDKSKYIVVEKMYDAECLTDDITIMDYYMYTFVYDKDTHIQQDITDFEWEEILNFPIWEESIKEYGDVCVYETILEDIKCFGYTEKTFKKNQKIYNDMILNIPEDINQIFNIDANFDMELFKKELELSKYKQELEDSKINIENNKKI